METIRKENSKKKNKTKAPFVVTVKTSSGGFVSMKQITPSEIKALRNPAYSYLA